MSRRPAAITQADIARAIRAAKQAGLNRVEIRDSHGNTIVFPLSGDPAPAVGNDNNAVDHRPEIVL